MEIWILIAVVVVLLLVIQLGVGFSKEDRRPADPNQPLGPANPGNLSPAMRAWRRRRAAAGKDDSWMTRNLLGTGTSSKTPREQFLPDDDEQ